MIKYNLLLDIVTLQAIHTALEERERELNEIGEEKEAFEFYRARKEVEAQLERQGVKFVQE